eukprot:PhF_6_TR27973/c0_g1_i1/m.41385/K01230/MAN1; mannosyl-oligosaccharide alpha-1,2-mannosidase
MLTRNSVWYIIVILLLFVTGSTLYYAAEPPYDQNTLLLLQQLRVSNEATVKRIEELSQSFSAIVKEAAAVQSTVVVEVSSGGGTNQTSSSSSSSHTNTFYSESIKVVSAELKQQLQDLQAQATEHFDELHKKVQMQVKLKQHQEDLQYGEDDGGGVGDPGPSPPPSPDPYAALDPAEQAKRRKEDVKKEFLWSWDAYKKYAWGMDELSPLSQTFKNWSKRNGGALGLTIMDAITTLWVMGLKEEFDIALKWVTTKLHWGKDVRASQFESTIRMVAGLLSAYEMSGEVHTPLLEKATELANRLLWAYNTSSGLPHASVNLKTHKHSNPGWTGPSSVLSEFGTVQLEFRTLSYHTKNPVYDMKVTHIMNIIEAKAPEDMLCPTYMSITALRWTSDQVSLGAMGDSFFEYLLKQYLLTNKSEKRYKDMFIRAADSITDKLLQKSEPSGFVYLAEWKHGGPYPKMDHLACFAGGMFALASIEVDTDDVRKKKWLKAGEDITYTCHMMYARQRSGIAPETVHFFGQDFENGALYYLLRPETVESYFYLWRITKDEKYRKWGWEVFSAIRQYCRVESGGYAGLRNIAILPPHQDDLMQSFWLAETLKYLYLLFDDDSNIDLKEWVFNTEAHPFKRRQRNPMDILEAWEEEHGSLPWKPPTIRGVERVETPKMFKARGGKKEPKLPPEPPMQDEPEGEDMSADDEEDGLVGDDPDPTPPPRSKQHQGMKGGATKPPPPRTPHPPTPTTVKPTSTPEEPSSKVSQPPSTK